MEYNLKRKIHKLGKIKVLGIITSLLVIVVLALYQVPMNNSWSAWTLPLSGEIIVLDPGHGGADGGAVSKTGIVEKNITLAITKSLRDYLDEAGAYVMMTRDTDVDLANPHTKGFSKRKVEDLQNRVRFVNDSKADFFISIHLNSIPSGKWHGAQTFYYPAREENKVMANFIQTELIRNLGNTDRIPLPRNDIMVLKYAKVPSVMVEVGFLSNKNEATLLNTPIYQKKIAFAIYQGLLRYYSGEDPLPERKFE